MTGNVVRLRKLPLRQFMVEGTVWAPDLVMGDIVTVDPDAPLEEGDWVAFRLPCQSANESPLFGQFWRRQDRRDHRGRFLANGDARRFMGLEGLIFDDRELTTGWPRIVGRVVALERNMDIAKQAGRAS